MNRLSKQPAVIVLGICLLAQSLCPAAVIWTEGEAASRSDVTRHPWWYDKIDTKQLSGGDYISNWSDRVGEVSYNVAATKAGEYQLWIRANPTATKLSYRLNDGEWRAVSFANAEGGANIAVDGKIDLRFIAWAPAGAVALKAGRNTVAFRFESENNHHGSLDCFVLADEPFKPMGILKPEQMAVERVKEAAKNAGWFAFDPPSDLFNSDAAVDLRPLNEKTAGEGGYIAAKGSQFVHRTTGMPIRFWAVNGIGKADDYASAVPVAKMLAKRGVNLVRLHGAVFDQNGVLQPENVRRIVDIVDACREQGIYTHLSIYFPLWMTPSPDNAFLQGYDGKTHPFAAIYFNPDFQKQYRTWWTALLTATSPRTKRKLIDEPAVMGCEIVNEDSLFFWTFNDKIPDPQRRLIESQFHDWAVKRYGNLGAAMKAWGNLRTPRDVEDRLGFRPLWNIANERRPRDIDTARFLAEEQKRFYEDSIQFLRTTGFKGVITASNWITASAEYLGPIEKYTYTPGDFLDRHGYFGNAHQGDNAAWSIRDGHTYFDRSALRFDPDQPGGKRAFANPVFDITYADKPTMLSETTFERPNRYRSEAPLFYSVYGSLQDTDAIVHFALDGSTWGVKPNFFMQPWTVTSPAMLGQFPAAALIYRRSLVSPGEVLVDLELPVDDVLSLKGTPLAEGVSLDELRLKDVPPGTPPAVDRPIDPLVHLAGQTRVHFTPKAGRSKVVDASKWIDRKAGVVTSSTGQVRLDYTAGLLTIRAPQAQGASGNLEAGKMIDLPDLSIRSDLELGHIVLVSLDQRPIAESGRMLLQVMSEEKPTGFATQPAAGGLKRITDIGRDPWLVAEIRGSVTLKRPDAARLKLTPLDHNGYRTGTRPAGKTIELAPDVLYYLIER